MPRQGVTLEQVNDAKREIEKRGERTTVEKIRRELGDTGSYSTIAGHIKTLLSESPDNVTTSEEVPEDISGNVNKLIEAIWTQAVHKASADLNALRKASHERVEALEALLDDAHQSMEILEGKLSVCHQERADLKREVDELKETNMRYEVKLEELQKGDAGQSGQLVSAISALTKKIAALPEPK